MPESVYRKCAQNFMCPGSGNVPEILPYTAPGKVKEMSKFPGVGNVHAMNKKYAHFMGFPCPGNLGFLPVFSSLKEINPYKVTVPDCIPAKVLKEITSLALIFS